MRTLVFPAVKLLSVLTLVTGVAYPLLVTCLAQVAFPRQASGSRVERDGRVIGSSLIGQSFTEARYFWSRPSATSPTPYNGAASSGSNLGPTNRALHAVVGERMAALRQRGIAGDIPVDLVTASGSGLDPHISPAAALAQVARVAHARHMSESDVAAIVAGLVEERTVGLLGEPRVNVLALNLALDRALDARSR